MCEFSEEIEQLRNCREFQQLKEAVELPFISSNSRQKCKAISRCVSYCGEVKQSCIDLMDFNKKER